MSRMRWPDFFIVGAARAGTTSLHHYLSQHPQISLPRIKETHFFAPTVAHNNQLAYNPIRSQAQYLALFEGIGRSVRSTPGLRKTKALAWQIMMGVRRRCLDPAPPGGLRWLNAVLAGSYTYPLMGEVCPSYLWDPESASRIRSANPAAKIIAILRSPVARAFSHYRLDVQTGIQPFSFQQALRNDLHHEPRGWGQSNLYLELGLYGMQLRRYFDRFPASRIRVILFDDLVSGREKVVRHLLRFLGVTDPDLPLDLSRILARSEGKLAAECPAETLKFLTDYYREDLTLLESLIGVDLEAWVSEHRG